MGRKKTSEEYKEGWNCDVCNCEWEETTKHYTDPQTHSYRVCNKHYIQLNKKGVIVDKSKSRKHEPQLCDVCGGDKKVDQMRRDNDYNGYLLCGKHSMQVTRHGRVFERTQYDKNDIDILEDWAEMTLYDKDQNAVGITKIDIDDVEKVSKHKWGLSTSTGYVYCGTAQYRGSLHRYLVDYDIVDHKSRDILDNRKSNLRSASVSENSMNTDIRVNNSSGFTGVHWINANSCWCASLTYKGKDFSQSGFKNKENAIKLRLKWEQKYFKEFAPQRHLFAEYGITEEETNIDE